MWRAFAAVVVAAPVAAGQVDFEWLAPDPMDGGLAEGITEYFADVSANRRGDVAIRVGRASDESTSFFVPSEQRAVVRRVGDAGPIEVDITPPVDGDALRASLVLPDGRLLLTFASVVESDFFPSRFGSDSMIVARDPSGDRGDISYTTGVPEVGSVTPAPQFNTLGEAASNEFLGDVFRTVRWDAAGEPTVVFEADLRDGGEPGLLVGTLSDAGWLFALTTPPIGSSDTKAVALTPTNDLVESDDPRLRSAVPVAARGSEAIVVPSRRGLDGQRGAVLWDAAAGTIEPLDLPVDPAIDDTLVWSQVFDRPAGPFVAEPQPDPSLYFPQARVLFDLRRGVIGFGSLLPEEVLAEGWAVERVEPRVNDLDQVVGVLRRTFGAPESEVFPNGRGTGQPRWIPIPGFPEPADPMVAVGVERPFRLTIRLNDADIAPTAGRFGTLDGADIAAFVRAFASGGRAADVDLDGAIDGADVRSFAEAFLGG